MKLEEVMTPDPERVRIDQPLAEAGRRMLRLGIRHLPVVDGTGALAGWLSDFDVFRRGAFLDGAQPDVERGWIAYDAQDDDLSCGDAMVGVEVTLNPEISATLALAELHRSDQDALVVVDARAHPIGIWSEHDALALALDTLDPELLASAVASSPVEGVEITEPAIVAFERLVAHPFRHLVVTEGGRLCGVLSLRDLVTDDVPRRSDLSIRDVVRSQAPYAGTAGSRMRDLVATMKLKKVGCVPIVDDRHQPVGMVTRRDAMALVLRDSSV